MDLLKTEKIIVDTGERVGRTKQVRVWFFDLQRLAEFSSQHEQSRKRNCSVFPINSTVFSDEQSHFSVGTVPFLGHGTTKEPPYEPPPPGSGGELDGEMVENLVTAAVWKEKVSGRVLRNEIGFKRAVARRIAQTGKSKEDWQTLLEYQTKTANKKKPGVVVMDAIDLDPIAMAKGQAMLKTIRKQKQQA